MRLLTLIDMGPRDAMIIASMKRMKMRAKNIFLKYLLRKARPKDTILPCFLFFDWKLSKRPRFSCGSGEVEAAARDP